MEKLFLLLTLVMVSCQDGSDEETKSSFRCDKQALTKCELDMDDIYQECIAGCKGVGSDLIQVCQSECNQTKIQGYDSCLELYCSESSPVVENQDNSNDTSGSNNSIDTEDDENKNPVCRMSCVEKRNDCFDTCSGSSDIECIDNCGAQEESCFDDCNELAVDISTDDGLDHSPTCEFDCDFSYTKCTNSCEALQCYTNCGTFRDACKEKCA